MWILAVIVVVIVAGALYIGSRKPDEAEAPSGSATSTVPRDADAAGASAVPAAAPASEPFTSAENVFLSESFETRDEVLRFVSEQAVALGIADDAEELLAAYLAREDEGTTGMMEGFAIPHAKADTVRRASVIVVRDVSGIQAWDTMDRQPVTVAIALLVPGAQAGTTHLKLLAKLAEALMDDAFRASIKRAAEADEIASIINARLS